MAAASEGTVEILPLPIAGLMSPLSAPEVSEKLKKLKACAKNWGAKLENPFMALSFFVAFGHTGVETDRSGTCGM